MDKTNPLLFRNLQALNLVGLWPPKTNQFHLLYWIYSRLIFVWFVTFTVSQFIEMGYIYNNFEELTTNAGVSLLYAVAIAKVSIILFKRDAVQALVDKIQEIEQKISRTTDSNLKSLFDDYILQNWQISKNFWILTFGTMIAFYFKPSLEYFLIGSEEIFFKNGTGTGRLKRPLVFSSYFPFDKYFGIYYYLAYVLQTLSGTIGSLYLAVWDTFIVALMIFAIGQFRILQYHLKNIYAYDILNRTTCSSVKDTNKNFIECVRHHHMVIQYIKDLDELTSPVMFLDFIVCSMMLCAIGLQATLEGPSVRFAFTVEYLISMLVQLFIFYWHANEIMIESVRVSSAAWHSAWYDCENSVKKGLVLMMIRAQKPCILTAGRFYTMTLQTFILILRASYSYLALLRQVYARTEDNNDA